LPYYLMLPFGCIRCNRRLAHVVAVVTPACSNAVSVQGLEKGIDYKKVLKAFKKDFCCNGTVVEDTELGQV